MASERALAARMLELLISAGFVFLALRSPLEKALPAGPALGAKATGAMLKIEFHAKCYASKMLFPSHVWSRLVLPQLHAHPVKECQG
jgi:hypothetical protein